MEYPTSKEFEENIGLCMEVVEKFHIIQLIDSDLAAAIIPTLIDNYADGLGIDAVEFAKSLVPLIETNHRENPDLYK